MGIIDEVRIVDQRKRYILIEFYTWTSFSYPASYV